MSSVRIRLLGFALVLVGLFSTAYAVGERLPGHAHGADDSAADAHASESGGAAMVMGATVDQLALASSSAGYQLVIDEHTPASLRFHIAEAGTPVTDFVEQHDALLHLLVVRRDLTGYQHVHPTMDADGTWSAAVDLSQPGAWRVVADSNPADADGIVALGVDVLVPGDMQPEPLPEPNDMVVVDGSDGLTVMRDGFHFTIDPVGELGPYLGQSAHLVAFREGDLAYVHLHPKNDMLGDLQFTNQLPGPGTYRLFLQFMHAGEVVTVPFTVVEESTS